MKTYPIQLADGLARMLRAQAPELEAVYHPAPTTEAADHECGQLFVAPGAVNSEVISRAGTRAFTNTVSVALVAACQPDDCQRFATLAATAERVGELIAQNPPLDLADQPMRAKAMEINIDPLYSADQLRAGRFVSIIEVVYQ